jgi:hypothetical protein
MLAKGRSDMEAALEKCLELFTEEQLRELRYADVC